MTSLSTNATTTAATQTTQLLSVAFLANAISTASPGSEGVQTVTMPAWLHHFAHTLCTLLMAPIVYHSLRFWSHKKPEFGKRLGLLNLLGSFYTIFVQILIASSPAGCPFFYNELVYYLSEFNLFFYRTAIFYQSNVSLYKFITFVFKFYNSVQMILTLLILGMNYKFERSVAYGFCTGTADSHPFPAIFSILFSMPIQIGMLIWGFYTLCKYYWSEKSSGRNSDLKVFWLMIASYILTMLGIAGVLLNNYVFKGSKPVLSWIGMAMDKLISLVLAFVAYDRIRRRSETRSSVGSSSRKAGGDSAKVNVYKGTVRGKPTKAGGN